LFICGTIPFIWENVFNDASEKDLWVNPVNAADILEQFPIEKMQEIHGLTKRPPQNGYADVLIKSYPISST